MKIIAFIEARQGQVVRQILEHCGLWQDPPSSVANAPPRSPPRPRRRSRRSGVRRPCCPMPEADAGVSYKIDPDYLEFIHRSSTTENGHARLQALDNQDQPELPWDA